jgi:hypothetical protein
MDSLDIGQPTNVLQMYSLATAVVNLGKILVEQVRFVCFSWSDEM